MEEIASFDIFHLPTFQRCYSSRKCGVGRFHINRTPFLPGGGMNLRGSAWGGSCKQCISSQVMNCARFYNQLHFRDSYDVETLRISGEFAGFAGLRFQRLKMPNFLWRHSSSLTPSASCIHNLIIRNTTIRHIDLFCSKPYETSRVIFRKLKTYAVSLCIFNNF